MPTKRPIRWWFCRNCAHVVKTNKKRVKCCTTAGMEPFPNQDATWAIYKVGGYRGLNDVVAELRGKPLTEQEVRDAELADIQAIAIPQAGGRRTPVTDLAAYIPSTRWSRK